MSNCVDQATIELIARNVVLRMVMDHTLQAGLRSCEPDCGWLGHETRVVTCDQMENAIEEALGLQVEDFKFDPETNQLTLRTNNSTHTVDLSVLEGGRPVALNVTADGVIELTTKDGEKITTSLAAYVDAAISQALGEALAGDGLRQDIIDLIHAELSRDEFREAVRELIEASFASGAFETAVDLRIQAGYSSAEFQGAVDSRIQAGYASEEFRGTVNSLIQAGYLSDEFGLAVDARISDAFDGDEFRDAVSDIAEDVMANMQAPSAASPSMSEDEALPTVMIGDRSAILGRPDGFMTIAGKRVPFWDDECAGQ